MKNAFLLCVCLFLQLSVAAQPAVSGQNPNSRKDSLENEKLELEIKELRNSMDNSGTSRIVTIIGTLIGVLTIVWSVYQGTKTIRVQTEQQKQNRISTLLESLSAKEPEKRASAASGLSRYSADIYQEVLFVLKLEQVEYIREILEEVLLKLPDREFETVIHANRATLIDRSRLLGALGVTGEKIETTEALLGIETESRLKIKSSFKYFFDHGEETARYQLFRASQLTDIPLNVKEGLISEALQAARVSYSTSKVIAKRISGGWEFRDFSKMDLNLANLYRVDLSGAKFYKSIVTNAILRHAQLSRACFVDSNFNKTDLFDCNIQDAEISKTTFNSVSLRKTKGAGCQISKSYFIGSVLSQSDLKSARCSDVDFSKSKIKGTIFTNSEFSGGKFNQCELDATDFSHSKITNVTFYGADMRETVFSHCILENVKFNGAHLQNANFNQCMLTNVDFSGADLENIRTGHWTLVNCTFHEVKNFDLPCMPS